MKMMIIYFVIINVVLLFVFGLCMPPEFGDTDITLHAPGTGPTSHNYGRDKGQAGGG